MTTETEDTMMKLTAAEYDQMQFLIRRPKWSGSDRAYDNMRIAEKVMFLLLDKDNQWSRDPRPLAARSYAIADAMINHSKIHPVDK